VSEDHSPTGESEEAGRPSRARSNASGREAIERYVDEILRAEPKRGRRRTERPADDLLALLKEMSGSGRGVAAAAIEVAKQLQGQGRFVEPDTLVREFRKAEKLTLERETAQAVVDNDEGSGIEALRKLIHRGGF
jgi:hypothetical protein